MPIIGEADRVALRQRFEESLDQEVTIKLFSESEIRSMLTLPRRTPNPMAKLARDLAEELAELSPKIKLEVYDIHGDGAEAARAMGIDLTPAYLLGDDPTGRLRFYGTPVGNEFATIIATVEALSQNTPHLSSNLAAAMERLVETPVHIQVFVTPT